MFSLPDEVNIKAINFIETYQEGEGIQAEFNILLIEITRFI